MLVNTTDKSTNIGRLGELYIYHTFIDYIHRIQIHHNNFDEMTSCEFPTGHPLLGIGRLIRCNWCNSDVESMKPYDLEVDVQGNWNHILILSYFIIGYCLLLLLFFLSVLKIIISLAK